MLKDEVDPFPYDPFYGGDYSDEEDSELNTAIAAEARERVNARREQDGKRKRRGRPQQRPRTEIILRVKPPPGGDYPPYHG